MRVLEAGITYFALVFGLGFLLGAIRVLFIVPRIGRRNAEFIEIPFMLVDIVLASRFVIKQFVLSNTILAYLTVGIVALSLVLIAEVLLVVWLQNITIRQYITSQNPVSGTTYLILLLTFALMPLIMLRN